MNTFSVACGLSTKAQCQLHMAVRGTLVAAVRRQLVTAQFSGNADSTPLKCRANALASALLAHCERMDFRLSDGCGAEDQQRRTCFTSDKLNAEPQKAYYLPALQSHEKLARQALRILTQDKWSLFRSSLVQTFHKFGPARVLFGPLLDHKGQVFHGDTL